uniref:Mobile element protein n=1 Tax=Escherichia coli TaxID=562 RepID=A0A6G6AK73_ECOLX|nr:Mobile element protein [Escherichia coli]
MIKWFREKSIIRQQDVRTRYLHDSLYQFCPELHLKRLNSLTLACHALLDCKTLTLTELGRNCQPKREQNITSNESTDC